MSVYRLSVLLKLRPRCKKTGSVEPPRVKELISVVELGLDEGEGDERELQRLVGEIVRDAKKDLGGYDDGAELVYWGAMRQLEGVRI